MTTFQSLVRSRISRLLFLALGLSIVLGCAVPAQEQKRGRPEPQKSALKYTAFNIFTDPPGAHVYGQDGTYWGQTGETEPVRRVFWHTSNTHYTVTVKKRGYKTVNHTWLVVYKYGSQPEAELHYEKMVILLDPE